MAVRNDGPVLLMALLFCIYTLTNSGGFHIVDEVSIFAVTESLALRRAEDTNAIAWTQFVNSPGEVLGAFGPDGQVYSKKGPAPSFVALPWYWLWRGVARLGVAIPFVQVTLLWNGVITALTAGLLWCMARAMGYTEKAGAALALLFGVCTIAWPYANHFFGEPLSALGLLLCFYGLYQWRVHNQWRWLWLAGGQRGAGFGHRGSTHSFNRRAWYVLAADFARTEAAVSSGIHTANLAANSPLDLDASDALSAAGDWRWAAAHGPIICCALVICWIRAIISMQARVLRRPGAAGLWGLLGSPYRGLFWHTPLFAATLVAFPFFGQRHRLEAFIIALLSVVLIGLYSKWWMWWGGFAWGPRFLVPLAPLWVLPLAECMNPPCASAICTCGLDGSSLL
ncbi:MAG: hypothetical protein H6641_13910 [Caldilineaceae bacterium]|nr:hypothetical protein [Caldilineaceae bacterium]